MPYGQLVVEATLDTRKVEQGVDLVDTMMRTLARGTTVIPIGIDTKGVKADLGQLDTMLKAALKPLNLSAELTWGIKGGDMVIEKSATMGEAFKRASATARQFEDVLSTLDKKGYGAFAGTLRGLEDIETATRTALKKLEEIGNVAPKAQKWNVSVGGFEGAKAADADLKRIGESLQKDSAFTVEFENHLKSMVEMLGGAAIKGEKLEAKMKEVGEVAPHSGASWKEQIASVAAGIGVYNLFGQAANMVVGGLKEGVLYNAKLQQTLIGFQTQLGGSSAKAKAFYLDIQHLSDVSPFKENALLPSSQRLLAAKVPLDQIKISLKAIDDQTAALGGNGEKFQTISHAMGNIFLKPHLQLQELTRELIGAGVPAFDMLAKAYHTNTAQVQEWISKGMIPGKEAFKALTNQMERANFGAAEKQSRTLEGAFSTLANRAERDLGGALSGTTELLTNLLNRLVYISGNKSFQEWTSRIGHAVAQGFSFVAATVKDVVLASLDIEKMLVEKSGLALSWYVAEWKQSSGFVWDILKQTTRNMAWFADVSSSLTQRAFGGNGDFFQKSLDGLINGVEGAASKGTQAVTGFVGDFKKAWGELYGLPKGLDLSKLWADSGKYADGLLKAGGKMPAEYTPQLGAPKNNAAAKAAAKLIKDHLSDTVALYDAMAAQAKKSYDAQAKAAEDSAKRQIDAFKSIQDKFAGIVGDFQDSLSKYGVVGNSPLDPAIASLEKLLNFGPRMAQTTKEALGNIADIQKQSATVQQADLTHSLHAKMLLDKMNGGDGQEPARAFKAAQLGTVSVPGNAPSWLQHMEASTGQTFGRNCALEITAQLRGAGVSIGAISAASLKKGWQVGLDENGRLAPGTILRWRPGMGGFKDGHYAAIGSDDAHFTESNMRRDGHGHNYISTDRTINWDKLTSQVRSGVALAFAPPNIARGIVSVSGAGGAIGNKLVSSLVGSTKTGAQVGVDESTGQGLVDSLVGALQDLKLSKIAPIPKEFGEPIREAEGHAGRFKIQMLLANEALQKNLHSMLGDQGLKAVAAQLEKNPMVAAPGALAKATAAFAGSASAQFKDLMQQLGLLGDTFDRTETRLRVRQQTFDLWAKQRMRGKENDPLAKLFFDERAGGSLEGLKPGGPGSLSATLRANRFVAAPGAAAKALKNEGKTESDYIGALRSDAWGDVSDKLKEVKRGLDEQTRSLGLARKFIQGTTVDSYGLARATELLAKKLEFSRSPEMVKLWNLNRRQFNVALSAHSRLDEQVYDGPKVEERRQWFIGITSELDKQTKSLQEQFDISAGLGFNETKVSDALAMQEDIRKTMSEARFTYGATPEEAARMGKFVADMGQAQRVLSRLGERNAAMDKQIQDITANSALSASLRAVYAFTKGGSAQQERSVFLAQKRAELEGQLGKQGGFADMNAVNLQYGIEKGKYDDSHATDRMAQASLKLGELQNDLFTQQLSLKRGIGDAAKQQLQWDNLGITFNEQDIAQQKQILGVINQQADLRMQDWKDQQNRRLQESGTFDPKKRADLQFRFSQQDAGFSNDQIDQMLPFDQMARKIDELNQRAQGFVDNFGSAWDTMFKDFGSKGLESVDSFFDSVTKSLNDWAAETLANATKRGIEGLLGKFATGILGGSSTPLSVPYSGASTLSFGDASKVVGATSTDALSMNALTSRDNVMMQAARDISMGAAARSTSAVGSGGDVYHVTNITHTGDIKANSPSEYRSKIEREAQGSRDSRRTTAKKGQTVIGIR